MRYIDKIRSWMVLLVFLEKRHYNWLNPSARGNRHLESQGANTSSLERVCNYIWEVEHPILWHFCTLNNIQIVQAVSEKCPMLACFWMKNHIGKENPTAGTMQIYCYQKSILFPNKYKDFVMCSWTLGGEQNLVQAHLKLGSANLDGDGKLWP